MNLERNHRILWLPRAARSYTLAIDTLRAKMAVARPRAASLPGASGPNMGSHHPIRKTVAPEIPTIPDKLYFRIGDVARLCDVPAYVLRFWETEFPNLKPNKGGTGQRLYRKREVELALRIKSLLYEQGYTIPGARQVFKSEVRPQAPNAPSGDPIPTLPAVPAPEPPPTLDIGAAIRHEAQQQAHLQSLRAEMLSLLTLLDSPLAPTVEPPATPSPAKPIRPRLILEPRPSQPAPPRLHLTQCDLFPFELPELSDHPE
jgi:DNA-binding transcriptional MerR regulator